MSRVYDALRQMEKEHNKRGASPSPHLASRLGDLVVEPAEFHGVSSVVMTASSSSRLVALLEPRSLGAEKFRALAARLENLFGQKEWKSLQITSSVISEGKTLVALNLAVTLAMHSRSKVLLLEGDLHRPSMTARLGLNGLRGLSQWWSQQGQDLTKFLYRLNDMPLWFVSAGEGHEQPSHLLQSSRFAEEFNRLTGWFDWVIVDSTPMLPVADVNLWSRLVDGTLLVVREGVAPIEALRKGIQSVDNLKLVGVVLNENAESDQTGYAGQYYCADRKTRSKTRESAP